MSLDISECEQGSKEWLRSKLGVISGSNVSSAIAKKGTATREGYMMELIAQIATGEMAEIDGPALRWGKENESQARSAYEFETNSVVTSVGFIYGKNRRIGVSPDGIITNSKGLELKCPFTSKVHIDFLLMDKIKIEYLYQVQFSMFVTGFNTWDFASYDKRMRKDVLKIHTIERDQTLMERFENDIGEFIVDMDKALNKLQIPWGSQWK